MSEQHTVNLGESHDAVLEDQEAGMEVSTNKSRKRRRNLRAIARDEYRFIKQEKAYKRIVLSVTQPSYLLGLGSDNVRQKNRLRLCHLLQKLMRQRNWAEASGVLSTLLKGTCKDKGPRMNRFKYTVSMELLTHMEFVDVDLTSIDSIYDTWMTRLGINLSFKEKRRGSMEEDRIAVRLESVLFQFMQGNIEGELQNARSLMRENDCDYPWFTVIMGLIFYQLFYSSVPQGMQFKDTDQIHSPTCPYMFDGTSHIDSMATEVRYKIGGSGCNAISNDVSESSFLYDSETSVMNGKTILAKASDDIGKKVIPVEVDLNQPRNLPQAFQPQGFYVNSAENEASTDDNGGHSHSILNMFGRKGLDSWLLPLQITDCELGKVIHNQEYEHAVKYLQAAVCSTTPSLAALLPLIQLLLIQYQYKEALQELEKFCEISHAALPTRLRACLLEHVDPNNNILLSTSYEETLIRDPTCSMSLAKLISMHQNGNYGHESLLEMIALHLDAVFAEYTVWREFTLCFLKVFINEQDCMSMCSNGNEGGKIEGCAVQYNIPKLFRRGKTGNTWSFRCRWWLTRHFSKNQLASEMDSGDLQLLTYKAACASHMYGPRFNYVVQVLACLEKEMDRDLLMFLKFHMKNSAGFYSSSQEKNRSSIRYSNS